MLNQCNFIGRLTARPESRFTQGGTQVANFTLCSDSGYGDKKKTEFVRVIAWDKLAKIVTDYLDKGSLCYISGEMQTRQWDDKDGNKRYTTEIVAREMKMLTPKGGPGNQTSSQEEPPAMGEDVPF